MTESKGQTEKLERLEAFEERLEVRIDALYAKIDESHIYTLHGREYPGICVTGEIHALIGTTISQRLKIVVDAYDSQGRVICTSDSSTLHPETFFGYETFEVYVGGTHPNLIKKIRIYPKATLY